MRNKCIDYTVCSENLEVRQNTELVCFNIELQGKRTTPSTTQIHRQTTKSNHSRNGATLYLLCKIFCIGPPKYALPLYMIK